MKKLIILVVCVALCSCKDVPRLGSYVYYDKYGCLHSDNKCNRLQKTNYRLMRVDVPKVKDIHSTCSECVPDYVYESLKDYADKNQYILELRSKMITEYSDIPSEDEFIKLMSDLDKALDVYRILLEDSVSWIPDKQEYLNGLGFDIDSDE